jgi:hypothetical protein
MLASTALDGDRLIQTPCIRPPRSIGNDDVAVVGGRNVSLAHAAGRRHPERLCGVLAIVSICDGKCQLISLQI